MTPDQRAVIRSWVGDTPDDADLAARFARLGDAHTVALEVLRWRRANFVAEPLSESLSGDYRQDASANIAALDSSIRQLEDLVAASSSTSGGTVTMGSLVRLDRERS